VKSWKKNSLEVERAASPFSNQPAAGSTSSVRGCTLDRRCGIIIPAGTKIKILNGGKTMKFYKNTFIKTTITYLTTMIFLCLSAQNFLIAKAYAAEGGEEHLQKGIQLYQDAFFDEAVKELKAAIQRGLTEKGSRAKAYEYLAFCTFAQGDQTSAKKYFKQAIKANVSLKPDEDIYSPPMLKLFNEAKTDIPIITGLKIEPREFYPLKGEDTTIAYNLSQDADVCFLIGKTKTSGIFWEASGSRLFGLNKILWNGKDAKDNLIRSGDYLYSLTSSTRNDDFLQSLRVRVSLDAPYGMDLKERISSYTGRKDRRYTTSIPGMPKKSLLADEDIKRHHKWKKHITEIPGAPKKLEEKSVKKFNTGCFMASSFWALIPSWAAYDLSKKPITGEYVKNDEGKVVSYDTKDHRDEDVKEWTTVAIAIVVGGLLLAAIFKDTTKVSIPENIAYNKRVNAEIAKRNAQIDVENAELLKQENEAIKQHNVQVDKEITKRSSEADTYNAETKRLIEQKNKQIDEENQKIKDTVKIVQEVIE